MQVIVRTLTGQEVEVTVPSHCTVKQLQALLVQQKPSLQECKLFYQGQRLSSKALVHDLQWHPGSFLTAVQAKTGNQSGKQPRKVITSDHPPAGEGTGCGTEAQVDPAPAGGFIAASATKDMALSPSMQRRAGGPLDTLLPGYASRPALSPAKPLLAGVASQAGLGEKPRAPTGVPRAQTRLPRTTTGVLPDVLHGDATMAAASGMGTTGAPQHSPLPSIWQQPAEELKSVTTGTAPHGSGQQPPPRHNPAADVVLVDRNPQASVPQASVPSGSRPPASQAYVAAQQKEQAHINCQLPSSLPSGPNLQADPAGETGPLQVTGTGCALAAATDGEAAAQAGTAREHDSGAQTEGSHEMQLQDNRCPPTDDEEKQPQGRSPQVAVADLAWRALEELPLPSCLQQLLTLFVGLNSLCTFLTRQRVQATWRLIHGSLGAHGLTLSTLASMAHLAPDVLVLHRHGRVLHGEPMLLGIGNALGTPHAQQYPGAIDAGGFTKQHDGLTDGLTSDGAGTVLLGSEGSEADADSVVVELLSFGRPRKARTSHKDQSQGVSAEDHQAGPQIDESAQQGLWKLLDGRLPERLPGASADKRRVAAFKRALLAGTMLVHDSWLHQHQRQHVLALPGPLQLPVPGAVPAAAAALEAAARTTALHPQQVAVASIEGATTATCVPANAAPRRRYRTGAGKDPSMTGFAISSGGQENAAGVPSETPAPSTRIKSNSNMVSQGAGSTRRRRAASVVAAQRIAATAQCGPMTDKQGAATLVVGADTAAAAARRKSRSATKHGDKQEANEYVRNPGGDANSSTKGSSSCRDDQFSHDSQDGGNSDVSSWRDAVGGTQQVAQECRQGGRHQGVQHGCTRRKVAGPGDMAASRKRKRIAGGLVGDSGKGPTGQPPKHPGKKAGKTRAQTMVAAPLEWHAEFRLHDITLTTVLQAVTDRRLKSVQQGASSGQGTKEDARLARPPFLMRKFEPCTDTALLHPVQFLKHLQSLSWYTDQVAHVEKVPSRTAVMCSPHWPLSQPTLAALQQQGIATLYSHQAQAIDAATGGRHVVVCTSTASGKSLCYNIPILEALAENPASCALYMFPTKALAQDQLRVMRGLCHSAFGNAAPSVDVYDGDTPQSERAAVRERAQLLITNPDMLHVSILPLHSAFGHILANLKYIVVDEGHAYRGVFGVHTAFVIRRLLRLCHEVYNSRPTCVVTSATVANPMEHVSKLLGLGRGHAEELVVVDVDGSPHGPKTFVLWNPPLAEQPYLQLDSEDKCVKPMTRTESKFKKRASKRAAGKAMRQQVRDRNQDRQRGAQLGRSSEVEWLAAVRRGRKQGVLSTDNPTATTLDSNATMASVDGVVAAASVDPANDVAASVDWGVANNQASGTDSQRPHMLQTGQAAAQKAAAAPAGCPGDAVHQLSDIRTLADLPRGTLSPSPLRALASARPHPVKQQTSASQVVAMGDLVGGQARQNGNTSDNPVRVLGGRPLGPVKSTAVVQGTGSGPCDKQQGPVGASGGRPDPPRPLLRRRFHGTRYMLPQLPSSAGKVELSDAEIQSRLPSSAESGWKERHGAAGTVTEERRTSPIVEISLLLAECIQHGLRTIAFCKTRKLCELVTAYTRETLKCTAPDRADKVAVYRAGYSPQERRAVEGALHTGALLAVAATNALELGIDVGHLDVTLHLGFPGSISSFKQQAGRAGRREQESLSIFVAFDGPLDQYLLANPNQLFGKAVEHATLDIRNQRCLQAHLLCAAHELPLLQEREERFFGAKVTEAATQLYDMGVLSRHPHATGPSGSLHYAGPLENPARGISLRAIDPERFAIVDEASGETIEEIEESKAFWEIYDGAVYMYQGRTYLCKKLDLHSKVALVRPADLKYYTKTADYCDVHVTGGNVAFPADAELLSWTATRAVCSTAVVTIRFLGFHRVWQGSGAVFDSVDLFLPDVCFETEAAYIRVPHHTRQLVQEAGLPFRDGLHAAAHAVLNVLPMFLPCEAIDVGTECDNPYRTTYRPERLLIFDKHPGGIGLAAQACPLFDTLLRMALRLIQRCTCTAEKGCPCCVQYTACTQYNAVLSKAAAVIILQATIAEEERHRAARQAAQLQQDANNFVVEVQHEQEELLAA